MLGAGTYTIPRTLVARDSRIEVDVSDLEPQLLELSQKYFDLTDVSRIHTYTIDGRVLLQQSTTTYDVIFGDAFGTDLSIPPHLATREFFEAVKEDLAPNGVFMLNYIGTLNTEAPTLTGSLVRTLRSVFPIVHIYGLNAQNPEVRQNIMFVARNGTEPIDLLLETIVNMDGTLTSLRDSEVPSGRFDLEHELVLTDDRAPVEYLMLAQQ
jgi:spermidine synthase